METDIVKTPAELLREEVNKQNKVLVTESYPMSIGELVSLYTGATDDEESSIILNPEFQRYFRWDLEQKSRLIESILIGIPIPSISVKQEINGKWSVIDGLQRLSTIFEFMGILKGENGLPFPPIQLTKTTYLPHLEGMKWKNPENPNFEFNQILKRDFQRKKINVNILLRHSDDFFQYELFDRLNSGGTPATAQEVRNAIIINENKSFFAEIEKYSALEDFVSAIRISDNLVEQQYDKELLVRFLTLKDKNPETVSNTPAHELVTKNIIALARDKARYASLFNDFAQTFKLLSKINNGDGAFARFDDKQQKYKGAFNVTAFEVIALGIGNHENISLLGLDDIPFIEQQIKTYWTDNDTRKIAAGKNTSQRLRLTLQKGRELFKKP